MLDPVNDCQPAQRAATCRRSDTGSKIYLLSLIHIFIAQNKLACDFTSLIEAKTVKPKTFIDYIQAANATDAAYRDNATTKAYKY